MMRIGVRKNEQLFYLRQVMVSLKQLHGEVLPSIRKSARSGSADLRGGQDGTEVKGTTAVQASPLAFREDVKDQPPWVPKTRCRDSGEHEITQWQKGEGQRGKSIQA